MKPYYKKNYREKMRDVFTKTFDQIYSEYSKFERVAYWLIIVIGFSAIIYVWALK